jgi:hypothetical protein
MTVTSADILAIRDELAKDPKLTPAEVVRGTRTLVHARLMDERPMPHLLPEPDPGKSDADFQKAAEDAMSIRDDNERVAKLSELHSAHVRHRAEREVRARAGVPLEDEIRYQSARVSRTPTGERVIPVTIKDAHHFVQYEHGKALWEDTDRLVAQAGVK